MDYKEKYEQLTKFIKDLYPFMSDYCKEKTEGMIPELKENEDEKIKTNIIKLLRFVRDTYHQYSDECDEAIAWVEKQSTPQVRKGNEWVNIIDDACEHRYAEEYAHGEYCHQQSFRWGFQEGVDWFEKQGKQTRTDAFIEKACEWLKKNVTYTHPGKGTEECVVNLNTFIEAMKGE